MALTKTPIELSSTPSIVDGGNATAITIDSSENVGIGTSSISSWTKLQVAGTAGAQTGASQALYITSPSTTANEGVGIRMSAASGSNEAVGIIGMVNNASGNSGSMTFHTYSGGADIPERMRISSDGRLIVNGTVAGYSGTDITVGSTTQATSGLSILNSTTGTGYLLFGDDDGDAAGGYRGQISYSHNSGEMYFVVEGATRFYINLSGHPFFPYIRNSAGSYTAKITAGSAELTFDTSSARYKDNIRDSTYGLSAAMQLQSRMFEYKEDNQRTDVGFIAEEVNEVIPELVVIDSEGRPDAVNYDRMTSVLLKAIQEQQATIEALTQRIETLENN